MLEIVESQGQKIFFKLSQLVFSTINRAYNRKQISSLRHFSDNVLNLSKETLIDEALKRV